MFILSALAIFTGLYARVNYNTQNYLLSHDTTISRFHFSYNDESVFSTGFEFGNVVQSSGGSYIGLVNSDNGVHFYSSISVVDEGVTTSFTIDLGKFEIYNSTGNVGGWNGTLFWENEGLYGFNYSINALIKYSSISYQNIFDEQPLYNSQRETDLNVPSSPSYFNFPYLSFNVYSESGLSDIVSDWGGNNSYNQGFADGKGQGYKEGYEQGVKDIGDNNYQTGYDNGYQMGYSAGISGNGYNFLNLFGAVADTPVIMVRNLFNFDLFGMSMLTVVLSLFTCLILFHLVKKLLK